MKFIFSLFLIFLMNMTANASIGYVDFFQEDFRTASSNKWWFDLIGKGEARWDGKLNQKLKAGTSDSSYSNSAAVTRISFAKKSLSLEVFGRKPCLGSLGWGFWNGSMDPAQLSMVWFIELNSSSDYPLNGFFAVVQSPGSEPEFYPLDSKLLESRHNYTIKWSDSIEFFVDGNRVAQSTKNVSTEMSVHIWIDNAVYNPTTLQPVFHENKSACELTSDRLLIN